MSILSSAFYDLYPNRPQTETTSIDILCEFHLGVSPESPYSPASYHSRIVPTVSIILLSLSIDFSNKTITYNSKSIRMSSMSVPTKKITSQALTTAMSARYGARQANASIPASHHIISRASSTCIRTRHQLLDGKYSISRSYSFRQSLHETQPYAQTRSHSVSQPTQPEPQASSPPKHYEFEDVSFISHLLSYSPSSQTINTSSNPGEIPLQLPLL